MNRKTSWLSWALLMLLVSCSSEPEKKLDSCVPGMVVDCSCSGTRGTQVCKDDGTFGFCECEGFDAGNPRDLGKRPDMAVSPDLGRPDLGGPDFGGPDLGPSDLGGPDSGPSDLGAPDLGAPDMSAPDTSIPDMNPDMGGSNVVDVCASANPPPRCTANPNGFAWSPASIVDFAQVEGTSSDPVCCFDINGDGTIDNSVGQLLAGFADLSVTNADLAAGLANGSIVVILEHQGLSALTGGSSYILNWWQGAWGPTMVQIAPTLNPVLVALSSAQGGTQPRAYFTFATIAQGKLVATGGNVELALGSFGAVLPLRISDARLEADVAPASAVPTPGIGLLNGRLGGAIAVREIFQAYNGVAASCTCLGLGGQPLIDVSSGACDASANAQACTTAGQQVCADLASNCNVFSAISLFADVDSDGDGLNESISIGLSLTARPAQIVGTTP